MQPGTVPGAAGGLSRSPRGHSHGGWVGEFILSVLVNAPEGEGLCLITADVGNDAAESPTRVGAAMPFPEIAARTGGTRQISPTVHVRHTRREVRHLVGT